MKLTIALGLGAAAGLAGTSLLTDYGRERSLRVETETSTTMETVAFEMERNGEPIESPWGGGGGGSESVRRVVTIDTALETEDGQPTRVRRYFDTVEGSTTVQMREDEAVLDRDPALDGVTLELSLEDGEAVAEVVDGDEPDHEEALEGHSLALALDSLLPGRDVEPEDAWELDADSIVNALGLNLEQALFAPPVREEGGERGRGGRRGGFGGRTGGSTNFLSIAEWEGEATLAATPEEYDGLEVMVIELAIEAEGDLPEPERGGGRSGRGGDSLQPFTFERQLESTYEIELEGRLLFCADSALPVLLEMEGTLATETTIEREGRDGGSMIIHTAREGEFTHTVSVTEVED